MISGIQHQPSAETLSRTSWKRAVPRKFVLLGVAWMLWLALIVLVHTWHLPFFANGGDGAGFQPSQPRTLVEADPGIAKTTLIGFAVFFLIETCSVVWRAVRHSSKAGVTGIVVAGLGFTAPLLFAFTPIGFLLLPFACLGVLLALPIGPIEPKGYPPAPPGWYPDPFLASPLRYWDGAMWTAWTG